MSNHTVSTQTLAIMKEKESEQLFSKQLFPCPCIKLDKGLLDYKTTYKRDIECQLSKHVLTEVYM